MSIVGRYFKMLVGWAAQIPVWLGVPRPSPDISYQAHTRGVRTKGIISAALRVAYLALLADLDGGHLLQFLRLSATQQSIKEFCCWVG